MEFTEKDKQYLEVADIDNAMLYRELKGLREELKAIKDNTDSEKMTKEKILAIKDTRKRLAAIRENLHLFSDMIPHK